MSMREKDEEYTSGEGRLAGYPHKNIQQQRFKIVNVTACLNQVRNGSTPLCVYLRSCQRVN